MWRQHLATTISIIALAFTVGLHCVVLQALAWVHMTYSYTGEASVYAAVKKALDSEITCVLCWEVDAGKKSAQDDPARVVAHELEGLMPGLHPVVTRPDTSCLGDGPLATFLAQSTAPPTPPP